MKFKQLLASGGMLVFVAAVVIGGTGAFFSDTETSEGNVFTAGSVSAALQNIEHEYYGDDEALPEDYFSTSTRNTVPFFIFNDLKPGDTGKITSIIENGDNDAYYCARKTLVDSDSTFEELLMFRVNEGDGLTAEQTFSPVVLGQWVSLDPADAGDPTGGALAVDANTTADLEIEYCFGEFQASVSGAAGCVVNDPGNPNVWNDAMGQSIEVDTEYYAIQQRNNKDFTCDQLNQQENPDLN